MAKYLDRNEFLRKEITQIHILPDGKISLIPLVGNHLIEMHSYDNLDKKLRKLELFYKKAMNQGGWGKYSKINIEYKNQIVCTKI
jgi:cell division protein FtsQ